MNRRFVWIGVAVFLGAVLTIIVLLMRQPYIFKGSVIDQPFRAPEIILPSSSGAVYDLASDQGIIVIIFFGYTSCPDVCPATLSELKQLRKQLGSQAENVQVLFVTVDPERDTIDKLKSYLSVFDPSFIGLTGSIAQLEPVWKAYGVYRNIQQKNSAAGYLVDHSSRMYLIDSKGNMRLTYSFGVPVSDLEQDIRYLIREK